ncbi:MAG: hypothetical protein ACPGSK_05380, partial [Alphaproteobacteria bacterium]
KPILMIRQGYTCPSPVLTSIFHRITDFNRPISPPIMRVIDLIACRIRPISQTGYFAAPWPLLHR